ncbi:hypothetical protein CY35_16G066300 [Sphagnum magellanicum]|nr:hypothetical protein CY35_16G066300 [Sphagnum magellanicum]
MMILKLLLALLMLLSINRSSASNCYNGYYQSEYALQTILGASNESTPDMMTNLAGWSSSQQYPCYSNQSWRGVICSYYADNITDPCNFTINIVVLHLTAASIVGTLPSAIGNLSQLVELTLTDNPGLSGNIPKELGNLTNLVILNLSNNDLNGSIPAELFGSNSIAFQQSTLQQIDLSNNQLSGNVPNLGGANWLQSVKISNNTLTGPSPPFYDPGTDYGFVNMTELTSIDLSENALVGSPPNLTAISRLQSVNLSSNYFNGSIIPTSIFNTSANLTILDLSHNNFTSLLPNLSTLSNSLTQLDLSFNSFSPKPYPTWLKDFNQLSMLALKRNGLSGSFPYDLASLPNLEILELDYNTFNGTLHINDIGRLGNILSNGNMTSHLQILSIQFNNIINVDDYSPKNITNITIVFMLQGNPYCTSNKQSTRQRCYCNQICLLLSDNSGRNIRQVIIISTTICVVILSLVIAIGGWIFWKNKQKNRYELIQIQQKFAEFEVQPTIFAYNELKVATRDFHPDTKLGEGAYGVVYKGTFRGNQVAVKQLFKKNQQNIDEFINEVVTISGVKHPNLVKLKGCCITTSSKRLLVYEYVENNDLAETLFEHKGNHILTWPMRFNIILGVACGLRYLHEYQPRIIHRDIKASNILLDNKFCAKIGDFGLAFLFPDDKTHMSMVEIAGTKGYLAPEYATRGQLTDKVDVFSFGVVALEVINGRKNIDYTLPPDDMYLLDNAWRWFYKNNMIENLVDKELQVHNEIELVEITQVVNIALLCLQVEAEKRPSMSHVVGMLKGEMEIEVLPIQNPRLDDLNRSYGKLKSSSKSLATVSEDFKDEDDQPWFEGISSNDRSSSSTNSNPFGSKYIELNIVRE